MKRIVWLSIVALVLIVVWVLAVPKFLSSEFVKGRLEEQLRDLTGQFVQLKGASSISLIPLLGITFQDVTIGELDETATGTVAEVEQLRAQLSLLPALVGDAKLTSLQLIRPRFNLKVSNNSLEKWLLQKGNSTEENPKDSMGIGPISIEDGEAIFVDEKYGSYERNLDVMIEHCYYHLGQVMLIKKLFR